MLLSYSYETWRDVTLTAYEERRGGGVRVFTYFSEKLNYFIQFVATLFNVFTGLEMNFILLVIGRPIHNWADNFMEKVTKNHARSTKHNR